LGFGLCAGKGPTLDHGRCWLALSQQEGSANENASRLLALSAGAAGWQDVMCERPHYCCLWVGATSKAKGSETLGFVHVKLVQQLFTSDKEAT